MDLGGIFSEAIGYVLVTAIVAFAARLQQIASRATREYQKAREEYAATKLEMATMQATVKVLTEQVEDKMALIEYFQKQNTGLIEQQSELQRQHNNKLDRLSTIESALTEAIHNRDKFEAELVKAKKEVVTLEKDLETTRAVLSESEREVYRYQGAQRIIKENNQEMKQILLALADRLRINVDIPPSKPVIDDAEMTTEKLADAVEKKPIVKE